MNSLLAYQRGQEESADRAGVRFLTVTGQSAKGMYDTFKRFADEIVVRVAGYIDPYAAEPSDAGRAHGGAGGAGEDVPYWDKKDPPELQFRHDMMRAKLYGFMERPDDGAAPLSAVRHQPARALRARHLRLSLRRSAQRHGADRQPDRVDAQQSLFLRTQRPGVARRRSPGGGDRAVAARRSTRARPRPYPDSAWQALVATNDSKLADEAIPLLRAALIKEPEDGDAYTTLAMAYGRKNDLADADLASAQAAFARGDNKTARELAARAKQRFPIGSPGWVRADDIVAFNNNQKNNPLRIGQ